MPAQWKNRTREKRELGNAPRGRPKVDYLETTYSRENMDKTQRICEVYVTEAQGICAFDAKEISSQQLRHINHSVLGYEVTLPV